MKLRKFHGYRVKWVTAVFGKRLLVATYSVLFCSDPDWKRTGQGFVLTSREVLISMKCLNRLLLSERRGWPEMASYSIWAAGLQLWKCWTM